ncbi:hypothetical protein [Halomonas sp. N3-2A]|uniref:hypothetical protein n=1 Tax=Halomonas sp. N3-2A TaxID=2014541 RepID=UPI0012FD5919|nr:hypothetical protein [Halomonas sp. N3-2A]
MTNTDSGQETYFAEIPLRLYFSTEEPIAIKDIATSLLALEKLTKRFPEMLEKLTQVEINGYELRVERLETGSLIEDFIMKVYFGSPEQEQAFREFLENHPMGKAIKVGIAGIGVLIVISHLMLLYKAFAGDDSPSIQANHNTIIQISSEQLGITPEEVIELAEVATEGNRKQLFSAARDVLRPVEGHQGATVVAPGIEGVPPVSLSSEALSEVPYDADLNADEREFEYENVPLEIRALDRDKTDSGWWGVLPGAVGDKRLRLYFDGVDMDAIAFRPVVHVDATVTYRSDFNQATLVPKHITITHIYPAQQQ